MKYFSNPQIFLRKPSNGLKSLITNNKFTIEEQRTVIWQQEHQLSLCNILTQKSLVHYGSATNYFKL